LSTRLNLKALCDIYEVKMLLLAGAKLGEELKQGGMLSSTFKRQRCHTMAAFLKRGGLV
jgi:hypothetical protein